MVPRRIRNRIGLDEGTVVEVLEGEGEITIRPVGRKRRVWKSLCGIRPRRVSKPSWPTVREIKGI